MISILRIFAKFLSINYFADNSKALIDYIHSLRESNSYRNRIYFIHFYLEASKVFSRNFFKKYDLNKIL